MLYKIGKKFFNLFINLLHSVQIVLIFLSFFTIFYWLLQLGGATFIEPFAPFFEWIKNITHLFYNRTVTVENVTVDFSFLIATFVFLLIVLGLKLVIQYIKILEEKYDYIYHQFKKKAENLFNLELEQEYLTKESKINNFLLLIRFSAENKSKDKFFDKDADVGVEEKQKQVLEEFSKIIEEKLNCQKRFVYEGLLLYFNNFNDIDKVLSTIEKKIMVLKQKYLTEHWVVNSIISADVYANVSEISLKTEKLILLNKLDLKDKIVCLATFKQRYSLIENPQHLIEEQGVYKIIKNDDVFCIKDGKRQT